MEVSIGTLFPSAEGISYAAPRRQKEDPMRRRAEICALIAALTVPLAAQGQSGWKVRIDGGHAMSAAAAAPGLTVAPTAKGTRVTGGPGAVIWDPAHSAKGVYSVKATFTLLKPSATTTDHGLVFGATDLEGTTPTYVYFTIAQDGAFQLRHRAGSEIHEIDKSLHFAILRPDASGRMSNTLEVQVAPTAVSYLINGAVVHATPTRAGTGSYTEGEKAHGIAGIRIDGAVDLQVDGFEVNSKFIPPVRGQ
jgi:hypothetical protein